MNMGSCHVTQAAKTRIFVILLVLFSADGTGISNSITTSSQVTQQIVSSMTKVSVTNLSIRKEKDFQHGWA
jgi:hypothetical protein